MLRKRVRNVYNKIRYGQDEDIIKELKKYFIHDDRVGYYQNRRFHCDALCCEATPGVLENVILLLEKITREEKDLKLNETFSTFLD